MHVLILPSWYPSSPEDINGSFFREQAIALHNYGHQVGVVYPQLRSLKEWRSLMGGPSGIQVEDDEGINTYRMHGVSWFVRMRRLQVWAFVLHGKRLYEAYVTEHGHPDVVHVHSMLHAGLIALWIKQKYGVPFVVTEHSTAWGRGLISRCELASSKRITREASMCFAVSAPFCEVLKNQLGLRNQKWFQIPNIVSPRFLSHPLSVVKGQNKFEFLNICLLTKKKAVDSLIHSFYKAFPNDKNVILKIGGDGSERDALEALVLDLNLSDRVKFLGTLSRQRVLETISLADVFVLPSKFETFGVVLIEALALGKPVIATRCGGPESIVEKGDGLLVPVDDIESLAQAMVDIRHTSKRFDALTIRERCSNRYSGYSVVKRLTNAYEKVVMKC